MSAASSTICEPGRSKWSEHHFRIFGFDPADGPPPVEEHLAHFEEHDRKEMLKALDEAIERHEPLDRQYRYKHPDGSTRIIHARGEITFEDGRPARLVGTSQDVTDREQARNSALRRAEMQRVIAELGEVALAATDLEPLFNEAVATTARALSVEHVLLTELELERDSFVIVAETGLSDLFGGRLPAGPTTQAGFTLAADGPIVVSDWAAEDRFERSAVTQRTGARSALTVIVRRRDGVFGVFGALSPEPNKFDADDVNFVQSLANLLAAAIERVEAEADTRHRSLHDPLTGLPNRVLFIDRLEQALATAKREAKQVGVLFCDLDQFKLVNDSLGHEAGDELLSMVAPRLRVRLALGRHGRPLRRRRVWPDRRRGGLDPRPHPGRRAARRGAGGAIRSLRPRAFRQRLGRNRRWRRRRRARGSDPRCRPRDVPRQGTWSRSLRDLRPPDAKPRGRPPPHGKRSAPRAEPRRARAPLPASCLSPGQRGGRLRSTGALAASRARTARPGRVHPPRRGERADRRAWGAGPSDGLPAGGSVARGAARLAADRYLGQRLASSDGGSCGCPHGWPASFARPVWIRWR